MGKGIIRTILFSRESDNSLIEIRVSKDSVVTEKSDGSIIKKSFLSKKLLTRYIRLRTRLYEKGGYKKEL